MSTAVKVLLSILLAAMFGLTLATLWIVGRRQGSPPATDPRAVTQQAMVADKVLDFSAFEMIERSGEEISFERLQGDVWVTSLFFSSCAHQCTNMNVAIAALQRDPILEDVKFVSVSVDPATDTPLVLQETAKIYNADPDRWWFMHADIPTIERFGKAIGVVAAFKTHVQTLVLIDRTGRVRGRFRFHDAEDIAELKKMVPVLLAEPRDGDSQEGA